MTYCTISGCRRPGDGYACNGCLGRLMADLAAVPELAGELATTMAKLTRSAPVSSSRFVHPLGFDWEASEATFVLAHVLCIWARQVAEHGGWVLHLPALGPHDAAVMASRWLAEARTALAGYPGIDQAHDEISDAVRLARRTIDRAALLWYGGRCQTCNLHLYAVANEWGDPISAVTTCRMCGSEQSLTRSRAAMQAEVAEREATATQIAQAMPIAYGVEITPARIWKWAQRGRLHSKGINSQGRPVYRIGDVRDLLKQGSLTKL